MTAVDRLARTAMLALAALATLALVGSLASVSNSSIGDAFPGEIATPQAIAVEPAPDPSEPRSALPRISDDTVAIPLVPAAARSPGEREITRWLKALTYAVLALASVAAAGVVALMRIAAR